MVKGRDEYRIDDPTVTVAAAANFIADHVSSGRSRKSVYGNAFCIINYARQVGHLPSGPAMDAKAFFAWAVLREGWESLANVPGLEFSVSVAIAGVGATGSTGAAAALGVPDDLASLKAAVGQLTLENEALRRELTSTQEELMACKEARARRSAQAREHGRRGGRGKAL